MDIYAGRCCRAVGIAYDWLYDEFTRAQRDSVQVKLKIQCERLHSAGPKFVWWWTALMHNHYWNAMSYLGCATYALMEEEPEAAVWEQTALQSLDDRFHLYGDVSDGSWYEAINY